MTTATLPVLEIIQELAPREIFTGRTEKNRYNCRCPLPGHESDARPSFSVHANGLAWGCFVCNAFGGPKELRSLLTGNGVYVTAPPKPQPSPSTKKPQKPKRTEPLQGATLERLAETKGMDAAWLASNLGWRNTTYGSGRKAVPAIGIPYYDQSGQIKFWRYRVGIDSKDRFRWESGAKMIAYGLQFVNSYADDYLILVEGETDFATLRQAGFPVLGVPGAAGFNASMAEVVRRFAEVYLWREPDRGGDTLATKVGSQVAQLKIISSNLAKDPCELAQLCGGQFRAKLQALIDNASEYQQPETEPDTGPGLYTGAERERLREAIKQGKQGLTADSVRPSSGIKTHTRVSDAKHDPVTGMQTWTVESKPRSMLSIYHEQSKEQAARLATGSAKIDMIVYRELPNYGHVDFPLFPMENRRIFPSQEDLTHWLEFADGRWAKNFIFGIDEGEPERNPKVVAQEHCLANGFMVCDDHGHRSKRVGSCGGKQCPHCGSARARSIGRVKLPEGNYRIVWHRMAIDLGPYDDMDLWGNQVNAVWKVAQKALGRVNTRIKSRRKLNQSRLLHRTVGYHMDYPTSTMHVKCTYWEETPGALDRDIARFERETGAELIWDSVTDDTTVAQLHMVGAATASLISVDRASQHSEEIRTHLFAAYWHGTKGEHLNRVLDWLEELIKELPETEKPVCDVANCGRELRWVFDATPGDQTTNPGHQDYAWRDPTKHPT